MNKTYLIIVAALLLLPGLIPAQNTYNLGVYSSSYDMVTDSNDNIFILWKTGTSTINIGKIVNNALTAIDSYTASLSIHTSFTRPRLAVKPDGTEIHTAFLSGNRSHIVHVWRNSSGVWDETIIWTYANDEWRLAFPAIGVDAGGQVHLICQRFNINEHLERYAHDYIVYARKTSSWLPGKYIQINDYPYRDTSMYTDKNGGIHATWKSRYTLGKYRYTDSGGSLVNSPTLLIPNISGFPNLGDIVSFGESCMDDVGNVHHAYFHFPDQTIQHVIKPVGSGSFGGLTQAATVDNCEHCTGCTLYENPWPALGVATDGKIYIAWAENRCSGAVNHVMLAVKDGGNWSVSQVTNSAGISSNGRPVVAVVDTDCYIVWRSNTGALMLSTGASGTVGEIAVTYPAGSETFSVGSTIPISWTTEDMSGNVGIGLMKSDDSGGYLVVKSVPYDSSPYNYTIPAEVESGNYYITIKQDAIVGNSEVFQILAFDTITVTYPNGGEVIPAGSAVNFTWTSTGSISNVHIELSTDNGSDWNTLYGSVPNTGNYSGIIPSDSSLSPNCLVRISDTDGSPSDTSDSVFTITSGGSESITVTRPNGGEAELAGTLQTITWTSIGGINNVKIEFSPDNGGYWGTLFESVPNTGSYAGIIPAETPASDYCLIRITDAADGFPTDTSDGVFSILPALPINVIYPAGGESYKAGADTIPITWTTKGITGNVKIFLVLNQFKYRLIAQVPHDSSPYNFEIPSKVPAGNYRIVIWQTQYYDKSKYFQISSSKTE